MIRNRLFIELSKSSFKAYHSHVSKVETPKVISTQKVIGQPTYFSHPHLMRDGELTPGIHQNEFKDRRKQLVDNISQFIFNQTSSDGQFMVVLPSACKKYMSDKIPYFFRQNTEFLYLTGCQEPGSCLIITSNGTGKYSSTLFVQGRDAHSELWDGPSICPSKVNELFGIDEGLPMNELNNYISSYLKSSSRVALWYDILQPTQNQVHSVLQSVLKDRKNYMLESPKMFIDQQRMIKSAAEIKLMRQSCKIASEAIVKTIETSQPGSNEHEIFAHVDYECRMRGAEYLAYPPVVAGGKRANIIHYITNNQIVEDGEMVLMDAGCEYHGYSSDITRTWPINGRFSREQRELYEAVLQAQLEIIELCKKFYSLDSLFDAMCLSLGKKLQEIGLISKSISKDALVKAAYKFCPHHVSHYLGMDVHDTPSISRNIPVRPGMIITVEPGIYVRDNDESVPKEYRGLGIRIEDDVLITETGPEVLSKHCPKEVNIIEKFANKSL